MTNITKNPALGWSAASSALLASGDAQRFLMAPKPEVYAKACEAAERTGNLSPFMNALYPQMGDPRAGIQSLPGAVPDRKPNPRRT